MADEQHTRYSPQFAGQTVDAQSADMQPDTTRPNDTQPNDTQPNSARPAGMPSPGLQPDDVPPQSSRTATPRPGNHRAGHAGHAGRDGWRRLHPVALIEDIASSIKATIGFLVVIVGIRIVRERSQWSIWAIIATIAFIVAITFMPPIVSWLTTRYRLSADSLELRTGLFSRTNRMIDYAAIHAIDSASPMYMQPFGVVRLTVSSAGTDADITLGAVPAALQLELELLRERSRAAHGTASDTASVVPSGSTESAAQAADAIRNKTGSEHIGGQAQVAQSVSGQATPAVSSVPAVPAAVAPAVPAIPVVPATPTTPAVPAVSPASACPAAASSAAAPITPANVPSTPANAPSISAANQPVFRASVRDILLFAITDLGFLAAALAIYAFADRIRDLIPREWVSAAEQSFDAIVTRGALSVALFALACVIVLMIVSIISSLLRFYGFELWRRGDDLVVVRGLFTRRTTTLPVSRIQTIMIQQSLLRQPFHLCSVSLGLSSSTTDGDDNESNADSANILPVVSTRRVIGLLRELLPEWDVRDVRNVPIRHTGRGLTRYYLTMPIALGVVAFVATATVIGVQDWSDDWKLWLIPVVVAVIFSAMMASRWWRSRIDGYAIMDDAGYDARNAVANHSGENLDTASTSASASSVHSAHRNVLSHRIMMTGAQMLTRFTLITRRSRVQSVTRSTTLWREPLGIERIEMPLFVTNGMSELTFLFLRRSDADRLAAWAESADR